MWRNPYWMPISAVTLASWQLMYPGQVNRAEIRNHVLGVAVEPGSHHMDKRSGVVQQQ
jgi:hypothetical protein